MVYAVEAWTYPTDEEGGEHEMERSEEFHTEESAMRWAWDRLEEGFAVRMYRR
jgi:hypothetical protein